MEKIKSNKHLNLSNNYLKTKVKKTDISNKTIEKQNFDDSLSLLTIHPLLEIYLALDYNKISLLVTEDIEHLNVELYEEYRNEACYVSNKFIKNNKLSIKQVEG